MPAHPQVQRFLDEVASYGFTPLDQLTPAEARAVAEGMPHPAPPVAATVLDRTIPGPAGDLPVRIYRPDGDAPLPVVVWIHGGGWVVGSIDDYDITCHELAVRTPAVVVSVDYRLAPEHPFPAALDDSVAAVAWVAAHAAEIGGDPARLAVAGDSAGGNLATVVARHARDDGGPAILFQLLVYPITDVTRSCESQQTNGEGYLLTGKMLDWFNDHYLPEGTDPQHPDVSPYFADDLSGLPPALVITAELDPLRDEGEAYAARLRDAGVDARASRYDGMIHSFFNLGPLLDVTQPARDEAVLALQKAFAS